MATTDYFIDSNIFLRHLTHDHVTLSPRATSIFQQIAKGRIKGYITSLVIHEVVYVLRYVYEVEKNAIVLQLKKLVSLTSLFVIDCEKDTLVQALHNYKTYTVDFPDCIYAGQAQAGKLKMLSFDADFKKLGVTPYSKP